jgi:glycosyltransferase involved in cell wall biosynthesis
LIDLAFVLKMHSQNEPFETRTNFCQVICGSRMDSWEEKVVEEVLARQGVDFEFRDAQIDRQPAQVLLTEPDGFPVTVFKNASTRGDWSEAEATAFLTYCEDALQRDRPDVVWTYGGDPVSLAIHRLAKRMDIPIVFALHNFSYPTAETFRSVDYVVVPAEYSRKYYWEKLGLACQILPNVVNWHEAYVERRDPRYVTFINPLPHKGVYVFARIARELSRRRPDISLLVTQGRSADTSLSLPELELVPLASGRLLPDGTVMPIAPVAEGQSACNLTIMPYTPDPRLFYRTVYSATKVLLMPSLWEEAFGLVAAEAMLNGIPVLGSNRGALPDTLGKAGFLFDIPERYTPETRDVPTAEEVEPWVETIIRLWDAATFYEQASQPAFTGKPSVGIPTELPKSIEPSSAASIPSPARRSCHGRTVNVKGREPSPNWGKPVSSQSEESCGVWRTILMLHVPEAARIYRLCSPYSD